MDNGCRYIQTPIKTEDRQMNHRLKDPCPPILCALVSLLGEVLHALCHSVQYTYCLDEASGLNKAIVTLL